MDSAGKPKPASHDVLKPYHASIAQWRGDGVTLREIAARLESAAGVVVHFTAIDRYCKDKNIQAEPRKKLPPSRASIPPKKPMRRPTALDFAETVVARPPAPKPAAGRATETEPSPGESQDDAAAEEMNEPRQEEPNAAEATQRHEAPAAQSSEKREQNPTPTARANKNATPFVHKPLGANRHAKERAPDDAQAASIFAPPHQPWEVAETVVTPEDKPIPEPAPPPEPTQSTPPVTPPAAASWGEMESFVKSEAAKIAAYCSSPEELRESIEKIIRSVEEGAPYVEAFHQPPIRNFIAGLRDVAEANSPEQLKRRPRLKKIRDWLYWKARAARLQRDLAASGRAQPPEPKPESAPAVATSPAPQSPLFVPLKPVPGWTHDLELVGFNGDADRFTLADACEGVAIFGSTGSGKTSGSGRTFACSYLDYGFGGLVLTAKVDECKLWQRYAEATGRTEQLCIVRPGGPFRFNFLDYQARLPDEQGGSTENVVELLMAILEAYAKNKPKAAVEGFWEDTARELLRNLIRVFRVAGEPVMLNRLRTFIAEAPLKEKSLASGNYRPGSLFTRLLTEAVRLSRGTGSAEMIDEAVRYWTGDFVRLNPRTRSIVITHFTSMVNLFFEPQIWELFCGETTITPDAVFDGAVIVVDLPIERFQSIGRLAAIIYKHFFQLVVPRRTDPDDPSRRPVLLWVDEAQNFMTEHDSLFQATARGSKATTVYLTQNISTCYAQAGGDKNRVDGFFSNLNTKIFHANNDPATNHWAAEMIGKAIKYRSNVSIQSEPPPEGFSFRSMFRPRKPQSSVSTNQQMDYEIQPAEFGRLRTGGIHPDRPEDDLQVDAYLVKSGARFSCGKNFFKTTFLQE